jgi:hypothetical protein
MSMHAAVVSDPSTTLPDMRPMTPRNRPERTRRLSAFWRSVCTPGFEPVPRDATTPAPARCR